MAHRESEKRSGSSVEEHQQEKEATKGNPGTEVLIEAISKLTYQHGRIL